MSPVKIGETTTDNQYLGRRDAFHVAAVLVRCYATVRPGDYVKFLGASVTPADKYDAQAIVDPFVGREIDDSRELFWVFPLPELVSNLTHKFDLEGVSNNEDNEDDGDNWCRTDGC